MTEFLISDAGFKYFDGPAKKGHYVQGAFVSSPGTPVEKEKGFLYGNGCPMYAGGRRQVQPGRKDCFTCGDDAPCAVNNTEGLSPELASIIEQNRQYNEALKSGRTQGSADIMESGQR